MPPQRSRYRGPFRLVVLLLLGVGLLVWTISQQSPSLTVENRSGQPIALLRVKLGDETFEQRDVATGTDVTARFRTRVDGPFSVEARFANGSLSRGQFGQIAGAPGGASGIVVLPGGQIQARPTRQGGRS